MFSLILQIAGSSSELSDKPPQSQISPEDAPITAMCDVTGGKLILFYTLIVVFYKTLVQLRKRLILQKINFYVIV